MLFGIYEQEVLNSLFDKPSTCRVIVDIGAADGYYPVGCLLSKQYDFAHAFEISALGQKCILDLAKLNNVESQIKINGEASHEALIDLFQNLPPSMILIDIEGAEFLLLTDEAVESMRKHFVIIEIHDFLVENGEKELIKLNNKLEKYFRISKFTTGARDLSVFSELHLYSDQDRWSICSERRQRLMWWWRLDPLT